MEVHKREIHVLFCYKKDTNINIQEIPSNGTYIKNTEVVRKQNFKDIEIIFLLLALSHSKLTRV